MKLLPLITAFLISVVLPARAVTEAEIQKFIDDAIKAGGGEVVIPPGVHVIEKGLLVKDAKKLRIVGLDAEKTVLQARSNEVAIIQLIGACESVRIEKLTFKDGVIGISKKAPAGAKETGDAVPTSLAVERCFFEEQGVNGLALDHVVNFRIKECTMRDMAGTAILIGSGTGKGLITRNFITRCQTGVSLQDTNEMVVNANEISNCGTGISIGTSASGDKAQGNQIINNALTHCKKAIATHEDALETTVERNEIVE